MSASPRVDYVLETRYASSLPDESSSSARSYGSRITANFVSRCLLFSLQRANSCRLTGRRSL
jgi:hypothetical protein